MPSLTCLIEEEKRRLRESFQAFEIAATRLFGLGKLVFSCQTGFLSAGIAVDQNGASERKALPAACECVFLTSLTGDGVTTLVPNISRCPGYFSVCGDLLLALVNERYIPPGLRYYPGETFFL